MGTTVETDSVFDHEADYGADNTSSPTHSPAGGAQNTGSDSVLGDPTADWTDASRSGFDSDLFSWADPRTGIGMETDATDMAAQREAAFAWFDNIKRLQTEVQSNVRQEAQTHDDLVSLVGNGLRFLFDWVETAAYKVAVLFGGPQSGGDGPYRGATDWVGWDMSTFDKFANEGVVDGFDPSSDPNYTPAEGQDGYGEPIEPEEEAVVVYDGVEIRDRNGDGKITIRGDGNLAAVEKSVAALGSVKEKLKAGIASSSDGIALSETDVKALVNFFGAVGEDNILGGAEAVMEAMLKSKEPGQDWSIAVPIKTNASGTGYMMIYLEPPFAEGYSWRMFTPGQEGANTEEAPPWRILAELDTLEVAVLQEKVDGYKAGLKVMGIVEASQVLADQQMRLAMRADSEDGALNANLRLGHLGRDVVEDFLASIENTYGASRAEAVKASLNGLQQGWDIFKEPEELQSWLGSRSPEERYLFQQNLEKTMRSQGALPAETSLEEFQGNMMSHLVGGYAWKQGYVAKVDGKTINCDASLAFEIAENNFVAALLNMGTEAALEKAKATANANIQPVSLKFAAVKQLAHYNVALYHRMAICASNIWVAESTADPNARIESQAYYNALDVIASGVGVALNQKIHKIATEPPKPKNPDEEIRDLLDDLFKDGASPLSKKIGEYHGRVGVNKDSAFGSALSLKGNNPNAGGSTVNGLGSLQNSAAKGLGSVLSDKVSSKLATEFINFFIISSQRAAQSGGSTSDANTSGAVPISSDTVQDINLDRRTSAAKTFDSSYVRKDKVYTTDDLLATQFERDTWAATEGTQLQDLSTADKVRFLLTEITYMVKTLAEMGTGEDHRLSSEAWTALSGSVPKIRQFIAGLSHNLAKLDANGCFERPASIEAANWNPTAQRLFEFVSRISDLIGTMRDHDGKADRDAAVDEAMTEFLSATSLIKGLVARATGEPVAQVDNVPYHSYSWQVDVPDDAVNEQGQPLKDYTYSISGAVWRDEDGHFHYTGAGNGIVCIRDADEVKYFHLKDLLNGEFTSLDVYLPQSLIDSAVAYNRYLKAHADDPTARQKWNWNGCSATDKADTLMMRAEWQTIDIGNWQQEINLYWENGWDSEEAERDWSITRIQHSVKINDRENRLETEAYEVWRVEGGYVDNNLTFVRILFDRDGNVIDLARYNTDGQLCDAAGKAIDRNGQPCFGTEIVWGDDHRWVLASDETQVLTQRGEDWGYMVNGVFRVVPEVDRRERGTVLETKTTQVVPPVMIDASLRPKLDELAEAAKRDSWDDGSQQMTVDIFNNTLYAMAGNDTIDGQWLDNQIDAGWGDDKVDAKQGNDKVFAGQGNDTVVGGQGDDCLQGGAGDDVLFGEAGRDSLYGGQGDDRLSAGKEDAFGDALYGGAGSDTLTGAEGKDSLMGGSGHDQIDADMGDDFVDGGTGNDRLVGWYGDDILIGNNGDDTLLGSLGNDRLRGDIGDDLIDGDVGADSLFGGSGNDTLVGGSGDDFYATGGGDDIIQDSQGSDIIEIDGAGLKTILWYRPSMVIYMARYAKNAGDLAPDIIVKDGNTYIVPRGTIDVDKVDTKRASVVCLKGYTGLVTFYTGHYAVDPNSTSRAKLVYGSSKSEQLFGQDGHDIIHGLAGNDRISGKGGRDSIDGGDGDDTLNGGAGHDSIFGGYGNDVVLGGSGNDILGGGEGNNTLAGGGNDDVLYGGSSSDTLRGGEGHDALYGGEGDDLLDDIDLGGTNYVYGNDTMDGGGGNDRIYGRFGNDRLYGGAGDDLIDAGEDDDSIEAGDGNDTVIGWTGNDTIVDGAGNDTLYGGSGVDVFIAGDGADVYDGGDSWDVVSYERHVAADGRTGLVINFANTQLSTGMARGDVYIDVSAFAGSVYNDTFYGSAGYDEIYAHYGDDIVHGYEGDDGLFGQFGNDTLYGGIGNDYLDGGDGNDVVFGGDGFNRIYGGDGLDTIYGGDNADHMWGGAGLDFMHGGNGDDWVNGDDGNDALYGGAGVDAVYGGNGDDWVNGDDGNDTVDGGDGHDRLYGGDGWDTVSGGAGDDYVFGGAGSEQIYGGEGNDTLDGGEDWDHMWGGTGQDIMYGSGGNDWVNGDDGNDALYGGWGVDAVYGGNGDDVVVGDDGDDTLNGGAGQDRLHGGTGLDHMIGGDGYDFMYGDAGNDLLDGGEGGDVMDGGSEDDALYGYGGHDVMYGGAGQDMLSGGNDMDELFGGTGDDILGGVDGSDYLFGEAGYDYLHGGDGDDYLQGGDNDDTLIGSSGTDSLWGGWGSDTFIATSGTGRDVVKDFGIGDQLRLTGITYSYSDFWGYHNKPKEVGHWSGLNWIVDGTEITTDDGRSIFLEGVRASWLKGSSSGGDWVWWM